MPRKNVPNVTLYFPPGMEWLQDVIYGVIDEAAKEGVKLSISDVVINALSEVFIESPFREKTRQPCRRKSAIPDKVLLNFNQEYQWLFLHLESIVQTKRLAGMKTSLSNEILRLATNSINNTTTGVGIDIEILKDFYETQLKNYTPTPKKKKRRNSGTGI